MSTKKVSTPATTQAVLPSRDKLRELIFNSNQAATTEIQFFGQTIELRQPTVGEIEELNRRREDSSSTIGDILVRYAYVPGTDERVFEEGDLDSIKALPWGPDFTNVTTAVAKLTGIDVGSAEKN